MFPVKLGFTSEDHVGLRQIQLVAEGGGRFLGPSAGLELHPDLDLKHANTQECCTEGQKPKLHLSVCVCVCEFIYLFVSSVVIAGMSSSYP